MPDLFSSFTLKDVTLRNRIVMSPMCQYSAPDGVMTPWHLVHLGSRAVGGAGLVIAEATAVSPDSRITPDDIGLWNDKQVEACQPVVKFIHDMGSVAGVQLQHAGRCSSSTSPWKGNTHLPEDHPEAWQNVGPSAVALGGSYTRVPQEMSIDDILSVQNDFAASAKRAADAGFRWIELHFGHSYLFQNFFSPLSNKREDAYGGSFEGRARLLLETAEKVRAAWPENLPLTARLGVKDFKAGEQPFEESLELIRLLRERGIDLIDVTLGFNDSSPAEVPWGQPAFMVPAAKIIRERLEIPTAVSWNIDAPELADELIRSGDVDLVMIGRKLLADPYWPYHAAQALGREAPQSTLPVQYSVWLNERPAISPDKA